MYILMLFISTEPELGTSEPGISGLDKRAPPGELEFCSRSNQKNISSLLLFFQFELEQNSCSPEGAVFSRPDIPDSDVSFTINTGVGQNDIS